MATYGKYTWIVSDPEMLGGKLAIRGTRLSVSLILECLASGMTLDDIDESFANGFPHEALPEVLSVAAELPVTEAVTETSSAFRAASARQSAVSM